MTSVPSYAGTQKKRSKVEAPSEEKRPIGGSLKRAGDVIFAVSVLIVISPLMGLIAALVWMQDRHASVFAHQRVGFDGKTFNCLKFRTMYPNSAELLALHLERDPSASEEWARTQKLRHDPRVTGVGAVLRVTSLDEIPQLFNVLRGEMSVVGPRPVTIEETRRYGDHYEVYKSARPGLTGLWQVSGRNLTTYEERVALDVKYVQTQSTLNDIRILARTVYVVAVRDGAC